MKFMNQKDTTESMPPVSSPADSMRGRVRAALDLCRQQLLDERTSNGHWEGELAASALSTATAVSALAAVVKNQANSNAPWKQLIQSGMRYLCQQQNDDGGFGDTDRSHSNIATSYLALAASTLASQTTGQSLSGERTSKLRDYIRQSGEIQGLRRRYGKDKTFVVPILCNMAIADLVDWNEVPALPFEAAVFPQSMYRFLQMPVVSYAIPALVAIGQARHFLGRRAFAPVRWMRGASIKRTMSVLLRMQPESGGYLEATPLTSFVVMSLAATHRCDHPVVKNGLRFLKDSMRDDGSWPIDTNLATWVTSLSVHALSCDPEDDGRWCTDELVQWHLSCQHKTRHPFTGADPGGWGWTDLSGAVPDGDDTPGAMLALKQHAKRIHHQTMFESDQSAHEEIDQALAAGRRWLAGLQNRDGGWPTFCRGWGKLPFDRSSTDLTAHAIRALGDELSDRQLRSAMSFLKISQQADGSWLPLWFGNQDRPEEDNPIYGTSRVLLTPNLVAGLGAEAVQRACQYLISAQNSDGGWGGGTSLAEKLARKTQDLDVSIPPEIISSVEETALVVEALSTIVLKQRDFRTSGGVETYLGTQEE